MKFFLRILPLFFPLFLSSSPVIVNITTETNYTGKTVENDYYVRIDLKGESCNEVSFRLDAEFSFKTLLYSLLETDVPDENLGDLTYEEGKTNITEINGTVEEIITSSTTLNRTSLNLNTKNKSKFIIIHFEITSEAADKDITLSSVASSSFEIVNITTAETFTGKSVENDYYVRIDLLGVKYKEVSFRFDAEFWYNYLDCYLLDKSVTDEELIKLNFDSKKTVVTEINTTKLHLRSSTIYRTALSLTPKTDSKFIVVHYNVNKENEGKDITLSAVGSLPAGKVINITTDNNSTHTSELSHYYIRIDLLSKEYKEVTFRLDAGFSFGSLDYALSESDVSDSNLVNLPYKNKETNVSEINDTFSAVLDLGSDIKKRTALKVDVKSAVKFVFVHFKIDVENVGKNMTLSAAALTGSDLLAVYVLAAILVLIGIIIGLVFLCKNKRTDEDYTNI